MTKQKQIAEMANDTPEVKVGDAVHIFEMPDPELMRGQRALLRILHKKEVSRAVPRRPRGVQIF